MSVFIGMDPSPACVRWRREDSSGMGTEGQTYRLCGCPLSITGRSLGYDAAMSWGDPLSFRGHLFECSGTNKSGLFEAVTRYQFVTPNDFSWLRGYFSHRCKQAPLLGSDASLAIAIPNGIDPGRQDDVLANLPAGCENTYLIWRPVAIMLDWLESMRMHGLAPSQYLGRRVFVLDLDGGSPELSEMTLARWRTNGEWTVPVRYPPRGGASTSIDACGTNAMLKALGGDPSLGQLVEGQFSPLVQELIESNKDGGRFWMRRAGCWSPAEVVVARDLPDDFWESLLGLFNDFDTMPSVGDLVICHGWVCRRYESRLRQLMSHAFSAEVTVSGAEAISRGASLFARRMVEGAPTYYDTLPDYQLWDSKAFEWRSLFSCDHEVEPGQVFVNEKDLRIARNNGEVTLYIRQAPEVSEERFARRLKVEFSRFIDEEVPLKLIVRARVARGSAELSFAMTDKQQRPVFLVDEKPAREIHFRYSVVDDGAVSGAWEPKHRGTPEPQAVLGRIYDSPRNVEMVKLLVEDPYSPKCMSLVLRYRHEAGFTQRDDLITSRVGLHAYPSQPTRGLFGTRRLPNHPDIDAVIAAFTRREYQTATNWELQQNYCHSFAVDEYKDWVRANLRSLRRGDTFSAYYAPGYVLGGKPGDLELLLRYIVKMPSHAGSSGKLWWSVFRMLCWHPEARVDDTSLLEKALCKLVSSDVKVLDPPVRNSRTGKTGRYTTDRKSAALAILFCCRARENRLPDGSQYEFPPSLCGMLVRLLRGSLADIPMPLTMLMNVRQEETLSEYVIRFLERKDTLRDRELGAQLSCER